MITVDKRSRIPLYFQLKEILLEQIEHSVAGDALPTENRLCEQFSISRPTVRQAIKELENEGYLYRLKGKGTFVAEKKVNQDFLLSFNDEMQEKGLTPTTRVMEFKMDEADEHIAATLMIPKASDVIRLRRLRSVNGEPLVLDLSFLPSELLPNMLAKDMTDESLYRVIEGDFNLRIDRAARRLEAMVAGEYEAKMLDIKPGAPIQYIETVTYLKNGRPIEFSQARYRGDKTNFSFTLMREHHR